MLDPTNFDFNKLLAPESIQSANTPLPQKKSRLLPIILIVLSFSALAIGSHYFTNKQSIEKI